MDRTRSQKGIETNLSPKVTLVYWFTIDRVFRSDNIKGVPNTAQQLLLVLLLAKIFTTIFASEDEDEPFKRKQYSSEREIGSISRFARRTCGAATKTRLNVAATKSTTEKWSKNGGILTKCGRCCRFLLGVQTQNSV